MYVTGDTHGNQILWDAYITPALKPKDTILVVGDFGIGFFKGRYLTEEQFYDYLEEEGYTVLFCDGNHENFDKLYSYEVKEWNGGRVHFIRKNVIHLMRGEIYEIEGKKIFVFGGGYSYDKDFRTPGKTWWEEELPNDEEYKNATNNLEACGYKVDYIISHTAPYNTIEYMMRSRFLVKKPAIEEGQLDGFLQWVAEKTKYEKWYFGHFHADGELWKNQYVLLDAIRDLESGEIMRMRMPFI